MKKYVFYALIITTALLSAMENGYHEYTTFSIESEDRIYHNPEDNTITAWRTETTITAEGQALFRQTMHVIHKLETNTDIVHYTRQTPASLNSLFPTSMPLTLYPYDEEMPIIATLKTNIQDLKNSLAQTAITQETVGR